MKPYSLLFAAILVLFLNGCTNLAIDNAGATAVTVDIDGQSIEVPAFSTVDAKFEAGQHSLRITDVTGKVLCDTLFQLAKAGMINASGSRYINWKLLYGLQADRATLLQETKTEIDSTTYFGEFTLYGEKSRYIERNWDYDINTPLPETQPLLIFSDFKIQSKLFRLADFKQEYLRMSGLETNK